MEQFLVILRGAPASGKTTIAKQMRSFEEKIVWLKVDNFKDFFSDEVTPAQQNYVDKSALATMEYLLDEGFSVVMEKIFFDPFIIPLAVAAADKRNIKVKVFQIDCNLKTLQERDRNRAGVKEGLRKPLGDELIEKIYNQLLNTQYNDAILLDTESLSIDDCVKKITSEMQHM